MCGVKQWLEVKGKNTLEEIQGLREQGSEMHPLPFCDDWIKQNGCIKPKFILILFNWFLLFELVKVIVMYC